MSTTYEAYLAALLAGDRRTAAAIIQKAYDEGSDLRALYLEVFQPALRQIGHLWELNEVTVAEEHLATAITQAIMASLYTQAAMAAETGRHLVAACPETERHEVGLRMLCDFMDMEGWSTTFLGAAVGSLARLVCEKAPDVLALSASISPHLTAMRATIGEVRAACGEHQPVILVGGRVFHETPELAYAVGADLTASDAREAAQLLKERFP